MLQKKLPRRKISDFYTGGSDQKGRISAMKKFETGVVGAELPEDLECFM